MVKLPDFSHPPVDVHCHFNHGSTLDVADSPVSRNDIEFLRDSYAHIGIAWGGISTYASVFHPKGAGVVESNRWLFDFAQKESWVRQWVVLDPRVEESFRQAEQMLASPKTLGLKIHPVFHQYDLAEFGDKIFGFANAHQAVVLMHPVMTPEGMAQAAHFADKYPDMKLIVAHLGSVEQVDLLQNHENIYTDTSGGASNLNNVLEYAYERVGSEKILFGTDGYSAEFQYGRVALSRLPYEDKENILYRNAMRLFPKAF